MRDMVGWCYLPTLQDSCLTGYLENSAIEVHGDAVILLTGQSAPGFSKKVGMDVRC